MRMKYAHSSAAVRKPVNLTINSELLAAARKAKINLSSVLEGALVQQLRQSRRETWLCANAKAIDAYNERVETDGLFSDSLRAF